MTALPAAGTAQVRNSLSPLSQKANGFSRRDPWLALPPPDFALLKRLNLIVFFDYAVSLAMFEKGGMLERELSLYRRIRPMLKTLTLITWSRGADAKFKPLLAADGIDLIFSERGWPYEFWLPWLTATFGWRFRGPRILKTNQFSGGQFIRWIARIHRTPLIARCGYSHELNRAREFGESHPVARAAAKLERSLFRSSDHVVVTSDQIAARAKAAGAPDDRISVAPNYVDTRLMAPPESRRSFPPAGVPLRAIFVGRLVESKNVSLIIEALGEVPGNSLDVIGDGPLLDSLKQQAEDAGVDVRFLGNLPHLRVAEHLRSADLFIFPSAYEGHPKSLLEAMACGLPVIAGDSPGIREAVRHRETGLLVPLNVEGARAALQELRRDPAFADRLGRNARDEITSTMSLDHAVERELRVLSHVTRKRWG